MILHTLCIGWMVILRVRFAAIKNISAGKESRQRITACEFYRNPVLRNDLSWSDDQATVRRHIDIG
jgi:hypothetical protein